MNQEQKLETWTERELKRNVHKIIIDDNSGGYIAFGKYHLCQAQSGCSVATWDRVIHVFANKRSALSWCIADRVNNINLANQILALDRKQQLLSADIYCRQGQGNRSKTDSFSEMVYTKVQPKIVKYNAVKAELEKCINSAKYIQIRGFYNETARTSGH